MYTATATTAPAPRASYLSAAQLTAPLDAAPLRKRAVSAVSAVSGFGDTYFEDVVADPHTETLRSAFAASGGLLSAEALVQQLRTHPGAVSPLSLVARWIVGRDIVKFESGAQTLIPMFQFDLDTLTVRQDVRQILAELTPAYDDLDVINWFAQPNSWLLGATPVDTLSQFPGDVFNAARADRFISKSM